MTRNPEGSNLQETPERSGSSSTKDRSSWSGSGLFRVQILRADVLGALGFHAPLSASVPARITIRDGAPVLAHPSFRTVVEQMDEHLVHAFSGPFSRRLCRGHTRDDDPDLFDSRIIQDHVLLVLRLGLRVLRVHNPNRNGDGARASTSRGASSERRNSTRPKRVLLLFYFRRLGTRP